jgi:hypothetical protein
LVATFEHKSRPPDFAIVQLGGSEGQQFMRLDLDRVLYFVGQPLERRDGCVLAVGSDIPYLLALYLGMLNADFEVTESPDLIQELAKLAARYTQAINRAVPGASSAEAPLY